MSYVSTVLADSPNGFWLLGEPSGNFADQTANAFTLTANGSITYGTATGHAGTPTGITLNGNASNNASHASTALLNTGVGGITIEALIKPPAATRSHFASKGSNGGNGFTFGVTSGGVLEAASNFSGTVQATGATVLSSSTFYLVALTAYTTLNGQWTVYVNGVADGSGTSSTPLTNTTGAFLVGGDLSAGTVVLPWSGTVSAVAFYQSILTASRLLAHFNALDQASGGGGSLNASVPPAVVARLLARKPKPVPKPPPSQRPPAPQPRPRFVPGVKPPKES